MRQGHGLTRALGLVMGACLLWSGLSGAASASVPPGRQPMVPTPGRSSQLATLACSPAGQCWAVGNWQTGTGNTISELLHWTGSQWVQVATPPTQASSSLNSVSCPAANNCLAVGWSATKRGKMAQAWVLRWDGTTWSQVNGPAGSTGLDAVSCSSPTACWALDLSTNSFVPWNGQSWGTPVPFSAFDGPSSLTCITATNCWAAGFFVKPNQLNLYNLVMHWNGHTWSISKVPQPGPANKLAGIACVTATDCWAAGNNTTATRETTQNEVLHWNGTAWSLVSVPAGSLPNSELLGVSCLAQADCWAVGDDSAATQALHWDGTAWSIVPTPDPGGAGFVNAVRCLGHADCLAVGQSHVPPVQNLALRWNGTAWKTA